MKTLLSILTIFCFFNIYSQNNIIAAEYFFDTDPGFENGTSLSVTNNNTISESYTINTTSLPEGFHTLYIRVKNSQNKWSLSGRRIFYKSPPIGNNDIVSAEYFFDNDPGFDNGISLNVTNNNAISESYTLSTTSLSQGFHNLFIRVKNSQNRWSLYGQRLFYKSPPIGNNDIVSAEYFIDVDPGVGNATVVAVTQGTTLSETINIDIPSDLPSGEHFLHLRILNSSGIWSLYARPEFESTLSANDTAFDNLKLYPNPVENILNVSFQNYTLDYFKIIDMTGQIVIEQTVNLNQIDLSTLASGFYLIQIKTSNGIISKKILKK